MNLNKVKLETHAKEILEAFNLNSVPIDLLYIAREEGIKLCKCKPIKGFYGRIESIVKNNKRFFLLYYPDLELHEYPPQVRFSIGHELGHYYIESHRQQLLENKFHFSISGKFTNPLEREADYFSSLLLIPDFYLDEAVSNGSEITLKKLSEISQACQASLTSTAVRYALSEKQEIVVILSKGEKILRTWHSENLPYGARPDYKMGVLPKYSFTKKSLDTGAYFLEGMSSQDSWFPSARNRFDVYEETQKLGTTGLSLTLLTF